MILFIIFVFLPVIFGIEFLLQDAVELSSRVKVQGQDYRIVSNNEVTTVLPTMDELRLNEAGNKVSVVSKRDATALADLPATVFELSVVWDQETVYFVEKGELFCLDLTTHSVTETGVQGLEPSSAWKRSLSFRLADYLIFYGHNSEQKLSFSSVFYRTAIWGIRLDQPADGAATGCRRAAGAVDGPVTEIDWYEIISTPPAYPGISPNGPPPPFLMIGIYTMEEEQRNMAQLSTDRALIVGGRSYTRLGSPVTAACDPPVVFSTTEHGFIQYSNVSLAQSCVPVGFDAVSLVLSSRPVALFTTGIHYGITGGGRDREPRIVAYDTSGSQLIGFWTLNVRRYGAALAELPTRPGSVLICGGLTIEGSPSDTCDLLDLDADTLTAFQGLRLPAARSFFSFVWLHPTKLLVVGGAETIQAWLFLEDGNDDDDLIVPDSTPETIVMTLGDADDVGKTNDGLFSWSDAAIYSVIAAAVAFVFIVILMAVCCCLLSRRRRRQGRTSKTFESSDSSRRLNARRGSVAQRRTRQNTLDRRNSHSGSIAGAARRTSYLGSSSSSSSPSNPRRQLSQQQMHRGGHQLQQEQLQQLHHQQLQQQQQPKAIPPALPLNARPAPSISHRATPSNPPVPVATPVAGGLQYRLGTAYSETASQTTTVDLPSLPGTHMTASTASTTSSTAAGEHYISVPDQSRKKTTTANGGYQKMRGSKSYTFPDPPTIRF